MNSGISGRALRFFAYTSRLAIQHHRRILIQFQDIVEFSSGRFYWTWRRCNDVEKFIGRCCTFATEPSYDDENVTEEILNEILVDICNAPSSSTTICSAYIAKLCRAGNISAAERLVHCLREREVDIGSEVYGILLAAASERNDTDLSFKVFKDLLLSGESLSSMSYLNFAKAFAGKRDHSQLVGLVEEIVELTSSSMTVVNRIIFAFGECGQIDEALLIFKHIKTMKCNADKYTYSIIIDILGCVGRVDEMLHEFASMKEAGIVPDIVCYNTLLNNLRKIGRLDICLVFLKEMDACGMAPNLRTYTALIESFGRAGNVEESLRLFDEMKMRQIPPSINIYRSLIHNLKNMGKVDLAAKLMEEMNSLGAKPFCPDEFRRKRRRNSGRRGDT